MTALVLVVDMDLGSKKKKSKTLGDRKHLVRLWRAVGQPPPSQNRCAHKHRCSHTHTLALRPRFIATRLCSLTGKEHFRV